MGIPSSSQPPGCVVVGGGRGEGTTCSWLLPVPPVLWRLTVRLGFCLCHAPTLPAECRVCRWTDLNLNLCPSSQELCDLGRGLPLSVPRPAGKNPSLLLTDPSGPLDEEQRCQGQWTPTTHGCPQPSALSLMFTIHPSIHPPSAPWSTHPVFQMGILNTRFPASLAAVVAAGVKALTLAPLVASGHRPGSNTKKGRRYGSCDAPEPSTGPGSEQPLSCFQVQGKAGTEPRRDPRPASCSCHLGPSTHPWEPHPFVRQGL